MKLHIKLILLLFMTLVFLNLTLIQDGPGALQHDMQQEFDLSTYKFSLLYVMTIMPGVFAFISGYLIDRYDGLTLNAYLSAVVANTGCIIYAVGCFQKTYWVMLIGRLIFGFSFTAMVHSVNCYKILCFGGDSILNMAFAVTNSVPWLGSSIAFFISNRIQIFASRYTSHINALDVAYVVPTLSSAVFSSIFILSILWMYNKYYKLPFHFDEEKCDAEKEKVSDKFTDLLKAPILFWMLISVSFFGYTTIMNLIMMSQDLFINGYNLDVTESSNLSSLLCILICILSPLTGYIIGKFGHNLKFATAGALMSTLGHGLFVLTSINPIWPVITLSLSYAFTAASVWPVIDFIVEKNEISRACGIAQSVLCFFLTIGAIVAGYIIDQYNYRGLELVYFISNACVLPLWLIVWRMDMKNGGLLNMNSTQRNKLMEQINNTNQ